MTTKPPVLTRVFGLSDDDVAQTIVHRTRIRRVGLETSTTAEAKRTIRAALDDEDAARATIVSLFEPGYVVEDQ